MRYLFQRKPGGNWYIRLQPPGAKPVERSLGTPDLKGAELVAADLIKQHKCLMYERRQARSVAIVLHDWVPEFEPGLHTLPDGRTLIATERDLTFSDGTRRPNGGLVINLAGADLPAGREFQLIDDAETGLIGPGPVPSDYWGGASGRPKLVMAKSHPDDAILETYILHKGLDAWREREAREMWRIFRTVVDKPLRECTRDDGRAIVAHLDAEAGGKAKSATLRRRMVPLVACVNLAIDEGKHSGINPFSSVVPDRKDEDERDAFNDDDMKTIRENLHKLDLHDQLLLRALATMGVRRGEAFEIASEQKEDGIRYCTIGTKTPQSLRRLPFPEDLLPHLPEKIRGPLFSGRQDSATKRLTKFLTEICILNSTDGRNVAPMHSFRHRAKNRLRRAVPDAELRDAIGGWTDGKKNSGRKYGNRHGAGYPLKMLRQAIDTIGGLS
jgi:hypothetical protein